MEEASKGVDSATVVRSPEDEQARVQAEMQQMIERDKLDPRQQYYLVNHVTGKLIRTNADYHRAEENHQALRQITYNQAMDLWRKEEAAKKAAQRKHIKAKAVRDARKKNR